MYIALYIGRFLVNLYTLVMNNYFGITLHMYSMYIPDADG